MLLSCTHAAVDAFVVQFYGMQLFPLTKGIKLGLVKGQMCLTFHLGLSL